MRIEAGPSIGAEGTGTRREIFSTGGNMPVGLDACFCGLRRALRGLAWSGVSPCGSGCALVCAHRGVRFEGSVAFTSFPTAMRSSHASRSLHLGKSERERGEGGG